MNALNRKIIKTFAKDQSGFALASSVLAMFFFGVLVATLAIDTDMFMSQSQSRVDAHQAFYAAQSGIDRAVFELRENPSWTPADLMTDPDYDPNTGLMRVLVNNATEAFYRIELIQALPGTPLEIPGFTGWQQFWIRSTGQDAQSQSGKSALQERSIVAGIVVTNPTRFGVSTMAEINLQSGAQVDFDVLARDINFQVNASLPSPLDEINVTGDVNYLRNLTGQNNQSVNISGQINQYRSVTFAGVNIGNYQSIVNDPNNASIVREEFGNVTIDLGNPGTNTAPNPQLVFVHGDARVFGTYDQSFILVADGNIIVADDVQANNAGPVPGPNDPQLGLLAAGDVEIEDTPSTDNLDLEAFIMADGQKPGTTGSVYSKGTGKGTLDFFGGLAARGSGVASGQSSINFNAFSNRNYQFNSNFVNNNNLPFLPFIANVIYWSEVNPNNAWPMASFQYESF